jgi:uncharacterized FlaG/YvyC family protein
MKSLQIANYCYALTFSDTIKFGVRVPATNNAKRQAEIAKQVEEITKLSEEAKASKEELAEQLEKLDRLFVENFETIPYELTKSIDNEILKLYTVKDDGSREEKPTKIQDVLSFLYENGIIK